MSVEVYLRKGMGGVLVPADQRSKDRLDKYKNGTVLRTELTKPRNYQFHKKFFAMRDVAFENQERYTDDEEFRKELIIAAGYYVEHHHLDGTVSREAKSMSFGAMDDNEFGELYAKVFWVIINQVLPGADASQFQSAVDQVMSFA